MKRNTLGSSDLVVSEIGLGCMSISPNNPEEGKKIIATALEAGVTFFDTADLYDFGWNESFIGEVLKPYRNQIVLATKVGNRFTPGVEGWEWDPSKTYIKAEVKESLRRLQTDYIDLYQLHGGTIEDRMDETIEAFDELKQEGVIREYGLSSIRPNVIDYYAEHSSIVSVLTQYSILDRRPEEQTLDRLAEKNISVIARGPLAKGWLSSRAFEKDGAAYLTYSSEEMKQLLTAFQETLPHRSLLELALRYPLHHPAVATIIPGASSATQLQETIAAGTCASLTEEEVKQLQALSKADVYEQHRL
ncbi:aldo/keto reductase [Fictibacillus macauensis ZFHKF-1]|uniref:Aldo/keto reductase n=1 Tax=Fictibacillus macauensis ZFHKF-1 TaxID=1196324 RepID=I8UK70_9BACL|nr:aldo/keto reductase [Fictibacillus macauensis]EIT87280.1 aldo/keto reductase [Fictibacillus macauensis ZFHKF-1]